MKKGLFFKNLIIVLTLFSTIVFSCRKDTLKSEGFNSNISILDKIEFKDGILVFEDFNHFESTFNLLSLDLALCAKIDNKFPEFSSSFEYFEKNIASVEDFNGDISKYQDIAYWRLEGDEYFLDRVIKSAVYSRLFNNKGLVKVGSELIKYEADKIVIFDSNNNIRQSIPTKTAVQERAYGTCESVYQFSGGNQFRKVRGTNDAEYALVYIGPGINALNMTGRTELSTTNYKRGFLGRWYTNVASDIRITNSTTGAVYRSSTNVSQVNAIVSSTPLSSSHSVTDSGSTGTCSL